MSAEHLLKGIELCIENARTMFFAGTSLKGNGFYGLANSILILCCEEGIKAFAIYNYFLQDDDRDIDKIFKHHKEKFEILKQGYELFSNEALLAAIAFEKAKEELPGGSNEEITHRARELADFFSKVIPEIKLTSEKDKEWWDQANVAKQNGFYVDVKDSTWITPQQLTIEQLEETHNKASLIIMHLTAYSEIDISSYKSKREESGNSEIH